MTNLPASLTTFEIKVPQTCEITPEAMEACFKTLPRIYTNFLDRIMGRQQAMAFEIVVVNQRIYFFATIPTQIASYFTSQLVAQYPQALVNKVSDFMPYFINPKQMKTATENNSFGQMTLTHPFYLPLKTYADFTNIDPLSTILGNLAKLNPKDKALIQILVSAPPSNWQAVGKSVANSTIPTSDPQKSIPHPQKHLIEKKIAQIGFQVGIKLLAISQSKTQSDLILTNIAGSFASIAHGEGNSLELKTPFFWQKTGFIKSFFTRNPSFTPRNHIFTATELATIYHLPNINLANIKNIAWGGTLKGEAPENLPIAWNLTEAGKQQINFFAKTEFKNKYMTYGIKKVDRRKHVYIIGKTGTGKSTLIANMAINDMRNGEGLAIVDPHGDLCDIILDYVPKNRINDVVYLDPNDTNRPFRLNPLQVNQIEQADLITSGIVAIFQKLFSYSWGPRLEYILRNTLLTLTQIPNTTMLDVTRILTDESFRNKIIDKIQDQTLKNFWKNEFNKLDSRARQEAISPILNKVGQFIMSPKIRLILENPQSSLDLDEIMNTGKILLLNLSQGKIGEDNAALLGAMFITKIQLAAMNRVNISEEKRRDFYLYVDEFQNFATSSFIKILSEARKYRLNLAVANQYIGQVNEDIQKAIFGNVGTLISFLVGAADASILKQEFSNLYEENDLVSLDNFTIINKLSIDNKTSTPFAGKTLPLPANKNQNREKVIRVSQEKYGKANKKPAQIINVNPLAKAHELLVKKPEANEIAPSPFIKEISNDRRSQAEQALCKLSQKGILNRPYNYQAKAKIVNQNTNKIENKTEEKENNTKQKSTNSAQNLSQQKKNNPSQNSSENKRTGFVVEVQD
ncbi:DUF87 domain-containing protein [Candidatus Beckwithbacteria bacterium]|nr:DUF87 domain-containing protein [Candidatus Beckwithbacteria bacterium]